MKHTDGLLPPSYVRIVEPVSAYKQRISERKEAQEWGSKVATTGAFHCVLTAISTGSIKLPKPNGGGIDSMQQSSCQANSTPIQGSEWNAYV